MDHLNPANAVKVKITSPLSREARRVKDLKPHPQNARIYGDGADADLVASVRAQGILTPLLITWDNRVIAGHRRLGAARLVGLETVPVEVFQSHNELDITEALVHANKQRDKSFEQIGREAQALLAVERERAKQRQQEHAGTAPGKGKTLVEPVPQVKDAGKARDKVGAALGVSGKTAATFSAVVVKIDVLKTEGKDAEAEELRQTLNKKGVGAAHKTVKPKDTVTPKPAPRYPHSDELERWLRFVQGQTWVIETDQRGIDTLLAEPEKWDWHRVIEILMDMRDVRDRLSNYIKKIEQYQMESGLYASGPDG